MTYTREIKARLFFSYLKGRTELLLYVKPRGTCGSEVVFRRSPGDAAMNLRIDALLESARVLRSEIDIWVLLFPPEVHTTTLYVPSSWRRSEIREQFRRDMLAQWPYFVNYDWRNFILKRRDNGNGKDMVTITILGKDVLPRIKLLLYRNTGKVTFVGDGLQFLRISENNYPQIRGQSYEIVLPFDEIFYRADFRSGIHVESQVLTHACSPNFGSYQLKAQQVYLKFMQNGSKLDLPQFQPLADRIAWLEALLAPAAFPTWFLAKNSQQHNGVMDFSEYFQTIGCSKQLPVDHNVIQRGQLLN